MLLNKQLHQIHAGNFDGLNSANEKIEIIKSHLEKNLPDFPSLPEIKILSECSELNEWILNHLQNESSVLSLDWFHLQLEKKIKKFIREKESN